MLKFLRIDKKNILLMPKSNNLINFQNYYLRKFSGKDHLKDDQLITDVMENIKEENKQKSKETQKKRQSDSVQEEDRNLGSSMKDVKDHKIDNAQISQSQTKDKQKGK
jgi:hypothetical protein